MKSFAKQQTISNETVFRRLNKSEYINTVGELFNITSELYELDTLFPDDQRFEGLDKIGSELRTSPFLYEKYIKAADFVVENFLKFSDSPKAKVYDFSFDELITRNYGPDYAVLARSVQKLRLDGGTIRPKDFTAPEDGIYKIKIFANALHQRHKIPRKFYQNDQDVPLRLSVVTGKMTDLNFKATFDMDQTKQWYECQFWLRKGETPWLIYSNAQMNIYNNNKKFLDLDFVKPLVKKLNIPPGKKFISNPYFHEVLKTLPIPQIRVYQTAIEGPFYEDKNPFSNQAVLLGQELTSDNWQQLLINFASRAFRKPQTTQSLQKYINAVTEDLESGVVLAKAFKSILKTILCSPDFLYLQEKNQKLDSYEIASRLSYLFWSSLPDKELLEKARLGLLTSKDEVLKQVRRMLEDKKSQNFIKDFSSAWLQLYDLEATSPDRRKFKDYYADFITESSKIETHLFFQHVLEKNKSIFDFLNSNYSFIDRSLSHFYNLKPVANYEDAVYTNEYGGKAKSTAFVKYTLPDNRRGGLMGHSTILTVSANGVDTSPIIRGAWIQEKLMNNPPPAPPEVVSDIGPDTQGAKSLKDRVKKHKDNASCVSCHEKFDPIGFALENYDATGKWRESYRFHPVDSSGKYNGKSFNDIVELKEILTEDKESFSKGFIKKMLMYATGRKLTFMDQQIIDDVISQVKEENYPLQNILEAVCTSKAFLHK